MKIGLLVMSINFYILDYGSDIGVDWEQWEDLKRKDENLTLNSFFQRNFTSENCVDLESVSMT